MKFIASRLTKDNFLFPSEVIFTGTSVTLRKPNFFSNKEKTIPFSRISSVDISTPMIGFSTITVETTGEGAIHTYGFFKKEVIDMKAHILSKI